MGIDPAYLGIADSNALGDPGPECLQEHVSVTSQGQGLLHAIPTAQVQDDALLSPVPDPKGRALGQRVPFGAFDLGHFGAVVGQEHGGQGPG